MLKKEELKILYQLDKNSRASIKQISKKADIPYNKTKKIIQKLEKEVIVNNFPMIEFRDLGYFFGILFIKLNNQKEKEEFFKEVRKFNQNTIILEFKGEYDAFIAMSISGLNKLNLALQEFNKRTSKFIKYYDCALANGFYRFFRSYLVGKKEFNSKSQVTGKDRKIYPIDPIDLKIISYLNRDCRKYNNEKLSKLMDMPIEQVERRIKYLEKEGTLQCYTVLLDYKKLNIERYRVLVKATGFDYKVERDFIKYCNADKNIIHFLRLFGTGDFLIEIEFFKEKNNIDNILKKIKKKFGKYFLKITPLKINNIYIYKDIVLNPTMVW